MNINPSLLKMESVTGLPINQDIDLSEEEEYMTFNYADERGALFADDKPIVEEANIQVHLFVKGTTNYMGLKETIKNYLIGIGAYGISIVSFYEKDTKKRHVIFEFEISEGRS